MALFINGVGQNSFNMNGVDIDNLYVDGVLVFTSTPQEAGLPRYELTEALVDPSTVDDSANTLDTYNGLLTESDGTTPYEPTALQYPQNGLLELDNGRIMDTQYTKAERDAQYGIYGADGSTVYNIWAIEYEITDHYHVWEGDQDTPIRVTYPSAYMPDIPSGTVEITDERPSFLPPLEAPELVDNPDFTDNIDGVVSEGADISWVAAGYWRTQTPNGTDRNATYTVTDLDIGVEYIADALVANAAGSFYSISILTPSDASYGDIYSSGAYVEPLIFTATDTSIKFRSRTSNGTSDYTDIDSISLKRNI